MTQRLGVLVLVIASLGCGTDELDHAPATSGSEGETDPPVDDLEADYPSLAATAYCEALFACDLSLCDSDAPYATAAECIETEQALLAEAQASAQAAGLTFDAECVQSVLATYEQIGCIGYTASFRDDYALDFQHWHCPAYHGSIPAGEGPCFEIVGTNYTECGARQRCSDETCIPMPVCDCGAGATCAEFEPDTACLPNVPTGQPCESGSQVPTPSCGTGDYCAYDPTANTQTCQPRLAMGVAC